MIFKGLLFWGIVVLALSALGYVFYRYLSSVSRYENRKKEIALGTACLVFTFASFLFLPVFLYGASGTVVGIADSIQKLIADGSKEAFMKDKDLHCKSAVDGLLEKHAADIPVPDDIDISEASKYAEKKLQEGIDSALKFAQRDLSKGKNFRQSLDSAAADLRNNGLVLDIPDAELKNEMDNFVFEAFSPFNEEAKKMFKSGSKIDPVMERMFSDVVDATPFGEVMGVSDRGGNTWKASDLLGGKLGDTADKAVGGVTKMLPRFFIIVACVLSLLCLVFFVVILLNLRESEEARASEFKKNHIFEYQQPVFDDINREKK